MTCFHGPLLSSRNNLTVLHGNAGFVHKKLDLIGFLFRGFTQVYVIQGLIISSDDLLLGGLLTHLVVAYTVTGHVNPHIRRRLVHALAEDLLENGFQNREYLNVSVVINCCYTVSFQMEGVYHIYII